MGRTRDKNRNREPGFLSLILKHNKSTACSHGAVSDYSCGGREALGRGGSRKRERQENGMRWRQMVVGMERRKPQW